MICINRNNPPPEDSNEDATWKKLQHILNKIYEGFEDDDLDLDLNINTPNTHEINQGSISDLVEIVYNKIYNEGFQCLGIMVEKNPNESLKIVVDEVQ
ncbi:MAG: hypothetical protein EBY39_11085 [Flavobacteriia bacterium]|nr:hypothetical protein [Flavobacteriia bacterium]